MKKIVISCIHRIGLLAMLLLAYACEGPQVEVDQLKAVSKFAILEVRLEKIILADDDWRLFPAIAGGISLNKTTYIAYSEATIHLGIDLENLQQDKIKIKDKQIAISLPAIEILDISYPFEKFKEDTLYTSANRRKLSPDRKFAIFRKAESEVLAMLPHLHLESRAQKKVKAFLRTLLHDIGFQNILIEFEKTPLDFSLDKPIKSELEHLLTPQSHSS